MILVYCHVLKAVVVGGGGGGIRLDVSITTIHHQELDASLVGALKGCPFHVVVALVVVT